MQEGNSQVGGLCPGIINNKGKPGRVRGPEKRPSTWQLTNKADQEG